MLRQPDASELTWVKERKIDGVQVLVKMTSSTSDAFRLRSAKTLTMGMVGSWKVQVYDVTQTEPLGEMTFTVGSSDKGLPLN